MKFKTKLAITFLTIILLPVLLSLCAFLGIGTIMMRSGGQTTYDEGMRAYSMMSESIDAFSQATDELFDRIQEQRRINLPILSSEKEIRFTMPEMQLPRSRFFPGCRRMGWRVRKRIPHITLMICASW